MRTRRRFSLAFAAAPSFDGDAVTVADVLPRDSEFFPGLRSGRAIQCLSIGKAQIAFPRDAGQMYSIRNAPRFDREGRTDDSHAGQNKNEF
ncbi:MAG: hypothetical protein FJ398_17185 [Verrucomicrobia bacterium]|nr:hypothetical protein [Verrucomicrobiota bacterium]